MRLNSKQIQQATGGIQLSFPKDTTRFVKRAVIDSRQVQKDDMFVAFNGQNVDGHKFVPAAIEAGAAVILVEKPMEDQVLHLANEMDCSILLVDDAEKSLVNIAKFWCKMLNCKIVGVTGSSGKTTTKNLIKDVLKTTYRTAYTKGNFNNELGVPITVTEINPEDQMAVVEMGTQHNGEISHLCKISKPHWGAITIIGTSHIELMGSQENIAKAKSELMQALPNNVGVAFLNATDNFSAFIIDYARLKQRGVEIVLYGGNEYNEKLGGRQVWAEEVELDEAGCPRFFIHAKGFCDGTSKNPIDQVARCKMKLMGLHNVQNACAAVAVGCAANISLYDCVGAINNSLPESGRQEILKSSSGVTVINDAYNASPESMEASLRMFDKMAVDGRRIAVLGNIAELGDYSRTSHEKIGKIVTCVRVDKIVCVGSEAKYIAQSAVANGMDAKKIVCCEDKKDALKVVENMVLPGDAVLVKASNCMGLQYIVKGLVS